MNFYDTPHWFIMLLCWAIFPRLTMLLTGFCFLPFAGFLFWVGWIFIPRFLIAFFATYHFWNTNPVLCVIAWVVAISGAWGAGNSIKN